MRFLSIINCGDGEKMKNKFKEKQGITLIALVVTIIILLILARDKHKYVNRAKWDFE